MKFYLAGKIGPMRASWRWRLFDSYSVDGNFQPGEDTLLYGGHQYVGPHWIDAWGGHGPSGDDGSHGLLSDFEASTFADEIGAAWNHGGDTLALRPAVIRRCVGQIRSCDVLFAWLESTDCYGTLTEIGLAAGLNKHVWIGIHKSVWVIEKPEVAEEYEQRVRDLWFAIGLADEVIYAPTAVDAFGGLQFRMGRKWLQTMPYNDYLQTPHWQAVRRGALERAGQRCQLCKSAEHLHVHHNTYERRGCEEPADVIVLCASCHSRFHAVKNGKATVTVR